jgi:hypothetical protein
MIAYGQGLTINHVCVAAVKDDTLKHGPPVSERTQKQEGPFTSSHPFSHEAVKRC